VSALRIGGVGDGEGNLVSRFTWAGDSREGDVTKLSDSVNPEGGR
jgi:hypothetical protein